MLREDPRAPDAFEDCVIRRILRFARHIAFRRALHRRGNRGIRRRSSRLGYSRFSEGSTGDPSLDRCFAEGTTVVESPRDGFEDLSP